MCLLKTPPNCLWSAQMKLCISWLVFGYKKKKSKKKNKKNIEVKKKKVKCFSRLACVLEVIIYSQGECMLLKEQ